MQESTNHIVKPSPRERFKGERFKSATLSTALLALLSAATMSVQAAELYMDTQTQQVFTSPGENRVKLSEFEEVNAAAGKVSPEERNALETKLTQQKKKSEKKKWSDVLSLRGYTQFRSSKTTSGDNINLASPGDQFISNNKNFGVRRARIVISGDVSDRLSVYLQQDFATGPDTGGVTGGLLATRDAYADIFLDDKKEYRIRAGINKIPYGFEILQSSQNRLAMERADAVSIASRDERDTGVAFYWAPAHIRDRFKELTSSGLKGSGDYGVLGLGIYNGQGLNRGELNNNLHKVARLNYPFKFDGGQFFEVGISALSGKYVPRASTTQGPPTFPTFDSKGVEDNRAGVHVVLYPQPFGLQSEWNWGSSPELNASRTKIEAAKLKGGYIQAMYKLDTNLGSWIPYAKWQRYDGSEKFITNAPRSILRETEIGVEWMPRPELELTVAYAKMDRTNVNTFVTALNGYRQVNADLLRVQLQWNY
ncbi:MAG: porin [Candidatus Nitrotoga sp.]